METEEEEERLRMRQKKEWQSSPYDKRFGADGRGNDRADRKLAASDCGVLKFVEKSHRVNNASVSDICRKGINNSGGHFDCGGGEFVIDRCECHVTIKRIRLY